MMKKLAQISTLILFVVSCVNSNSDTNSISYQSETDSINWTYWTPNLDSIDPLQFLDSLKIIHGRYRRIVLEQDEKSNYSNEEIYSISKIPENWIKIEYIDSLIILLADTSLTIPVFSRYANELPINKPYTTVGIEAMRLLQGFKNNRYPSLWPEFYAKDTITENYKTIKNELISWWRNKKNNNWR